MSIPIRDERKEILDRDAEVLSKTSLLKKVLCNNAIFSSSVKPLNRGYAEGFGKSRLSIVKVEYAYNGELPNRFLLKIYGWQNKTSIDEEFEREFKFYELFPTNLTYELGGEKIRPIPKVYSLDRTNSREYIEKKAFLMDLLSEQTLRTYMMDLIKNKSENSRDYLIYRSLKPLVVIHDNLATDLYRDSMQDNLAIESNPNDYAQRLSTSLRKIVYFTTPSGLGKDQFKKAEEMPEASDVIGEDIATGGNLKRIINGELYPHNHLVDTIIDWGTVAIGPLTLDIGYLFGSFPFDSQDITSAIDIYTDLSTSKNLNKKELERKTRLTSIFARLEATYQTIETLVGVYQSNEKINNNFAQEEFINKLIHGEQLGMAGNITRAKEEIGILLKRRRELEVSSKLEKALKTIQSYLQIETSEEQGKFFEIDFFGLSFRISSKSNKKKKPRDLVKVR